MRRNAGAGYRSIDKERDQTNVGKAKIIAKASTKDAQRLEEYMRDHTSCLMQT